MPPKATKKKQPTKCLKLGQILIDENKKLIYLCTQCFFDFAEFHDLLQHLKTCVSHVFKAQSHSKISFNNDGTKLLNKVIKDAKELHIYGIQQKDKDVEEEDISKENGDISDFLNIEEELLNPRWFTDTTPKDEIEEIYKNDRKKETSYNDLIMEVTPFVQFKENVKTNISSRVTREGAKQNAAKEREEKSNTIAMQNKRKTDSLGLQGRLYLSEDKKHILRTALEECTKTSVSDSKESIKRQKKSETKTIATTKKSLLKNLKDKTEMIQETIEKEKVTASKPQKELNKRKIVSLPATVNEEKNDIDTHNMVKRRRTITKETESKSRKTRAFQSTKTKETPKIQTSSGKSAQNASPVISKNQKTIIVSNKKENKTTVNTKDTIQNKEKNALPSNRQSLPQTQKQTQSQPQKQTQPQPQVHQSLQIKVNTNFNRLDPSMTNATKGTSNEPILLNTDSKIQTKESQNTTTTTTTKFIQHIPIVNSSPISKKILNFQSTTTPTTPTTTTPTIVQKSTDSSNQKTVEILNKLQTLGLKVQRTNPTPEQCKKKVQSPANEQALEIIKKLQSKGMNVKIVQKPSTSTTTTTTPITAITTVPMKDSIIEPFTIIHNPEPQTIFGRNTGNLADNLSSFNLPKCNTTDTNIILASKPNFSKNILIKKFT